MTGARRVPPGFFWTTHCERPIRAFVYPNPMRGPLQHHINAPSVPLPQSGALPSHMGQLSPPLSPDPDLSSGLEIYLSPVSPFPAYGALPYYDADELDDLSVPEAIEDTSDESEALSTPPLGRSSELDFVDSTSLPGQRRRRRSQAHVYIRQPDFYFDRYALDPLPFPGCKRSRSLAQRRNYHATKKKKPATSSSRPPNTHITQQPSGTHYTTPISFTTTRPLPTIDLRQPTFVHLSQPLRFSPHTNPVHHDQFRDPLDFSATLPLLWAHLNPGTLT
ncbi:hypothetical protein EDD22DRAFT_959780 [Suillus occidentalis]|nr:hypothetical protein EDD22DRAFT_959780 [Suillus occidentalis]